MKIWVGVLLSLFLVGCEESTGQISDTRLRGFDTFTSSMTTSDWVAVQIFSSSKTRTREDVLQAYKEAEIFLKARDECK